MNIFLDTSILFKLYRQEEGSQEVDALLTKAKSLVLKYKIEGLRTLDAIQRASAITIKHDIAIVITSNDRLAKTADL